MHDTDSLLLVSMPFAGINIPSIQLGVLESYLHKHDQNITTKHIYLNAAKFYGLKFYNFLLSPPNDSYNAQLVFSKYVFPNHWKQKYDEIKEFYNKHICRTKQFQTLFPFDKYEQASDVLYHWILKNCNWHSYDVIGFSLNYGQFLPSLALAKAIKKEYPDKKIVFGGSRTVGTLGVHVLQSFDFIDYIITGEGEAALVQLLKHPDKLNRVPNVIYRQEKKVLCTPQTTSVSLNELPVPSFASFFDLIQELSGDIYQFYALFGKLPVEISRGCWWNKCTFCNLNIQHSSYREKSTEKIVAEVKYLQKKYKILDYYLLGNTLPQQKYHSLLEGLHDINADLTFFVETRAGYIPRNYYQLLHNAGFNTIQTGIESFSTHYLQKMNKGTRVIDNIAALKFCREHDITNTYNIVINYPNEEDQDFQETKDNIQRFMQFLDPPHLCPLVIAYGSPIYRFPKKFNIKKLVHTKVDKLMFPLKILNNHISFFYDFEKEIPYENHDWETLHAEWQTTRNTLKKEAEQRNTLFDRLVFYYVDGEDFIKIYDKRDINNYQIYILNKTERSIFLHCQNVITDNELCEICSDIPEYKIAAILHSLEENGIVFREDNSYLSLPLCATIQKHPLPRIMRKESAMIYNSGSQRSL